ncbi:glycosyltransferase family 2 protein [Acetivibrio cellulolyticus]|uniref:glycosyltransferase family 2 protein n=1 Tax=Acetivibrio cellulolyticus TaxID=35830 RepID=UPI0001E2D8CD|nr:glycosyltransferase family 2 protein [Acetivibrio cellulolyticus]
MYKSLESQIQPDGEITRRTRTSDYISIIIPCYNEGKVLHVLHNKLCEIAQMMPEVSFEYIFVDDGSKDETLEIIRALAAKDQKVKYVSFSRNFGKEAAMYAGMEMAAGDYVAIIDADMQDPPTMIPQMYKGIKEEGFDCVAARRVNRIGEPKIRSFFARQFYKIMRKLSNTEIVDGARDFRLMTRQMTNSILSVYEYNRFSKGIFSWVGFSTKWLEYENVERVGGESKWSFWKLFLYSIDGIVAFSTAPLALSSLLGIFLCLIAFITIIFTIVRQLVWGGSAYGWSSMVCIILFLSGIQLFCIGILGQYLSKTYLEAKNRPIYIVREQSGGNDESK